MVLYIPGGCWGFLNHQLVTLVNYTLKTHENQISMGCFWASSGSTPKICEKKSAVVNLENHPTFSKCLVTVTSLFLCPKKTGQFENLEGEEPQADP